MHSIKHNTYNIKKQRHFQCNSSAESTTMSGGCLTVYGENTERGRDVVKGGMWKTKFPSETQKVELSDFIVQYNNIYLRWNIMCFATNLILRVLQIMAFLRFDLVTKIVKCW